MSVNLQGLLYFWTHCGWRPIYFCNESVVKMIDTWGISSSIQRQSLHAGDESSGQLLFLKDIFIFLHLSPWELRPLNGTFWLNTCETSICQIDFMKRKRKKVDVCSTIKISLFFIQCPTPAALPVSCIFLCADLNFWSPQRASAETWYKCKAKRIWDWSRVHFFGQSNSCCLPFTGSQNHSGALPGSQCLDNSVCVFICECVCVNPLHVVCVWICACDFSLMHA